MIDQFESELNALQDYMSSLTPQALSINQCEISYINHIKFDRAQDEGFSSWLRFLNFPKGIPDDFSINFRETIEDDDFKPLGRLYVDAALGYMPNGTEIIMLTIAAKGAPQGTDINSALKFLEQGRRLIVQRFAELTTDEAHGKWERVK